MLNNLWEIICQAIADHYFYKYIRTKKQSDFDKYNDWIDRKFHNKVDWRKG